MNLNQLYYFKTIANLQHFRIASERLNVSQPSLSASMSSLEKELGVVLFEKQGRNIKLTKYGKIFLEYVENSLETLDVGINKIKTLTNNTGGNIDIAYVFPLAPSYIPKIVRKFLDENENKNISFTFKQGLTSEIVDGLKNSKYDLGFCSYIENEENIIFEPIIEQELVLIAPKNHPLSNKKEINIKEIEKYEVIVYFKKSGLGQLTYKIFNDNNINPNIIFEGENEHSILGLVAENFGIALVGKTPLLKNSNVKQIKVKELDYKRYIYLAYVKNRYFPPAVKKFLEYVKKTPSSL